MAHVALVLLHSPLVGPLTWRGVASRLALAGFEVVTPDLTGAVTGEPSHQQAVAGAVAASVGSVAADTPVVLVGHSGAGPLLPRIARTVPREVPALIYVDSLLPYPGAAWVARAPQSLVGHLHGLVSDGRLPPWNEWFPPEAITESLPDPGLRAQFVAELPRLPFSYFTERTSLDAWPGRAGYLLLSEGYRPEAQAARRAGMPVVEHIDHHLSMLTAPATVSGCLEELLRKTIPTSRS